MLTFLPGLIFLNPTLSKRTFCTVKVLHSKSIAWKICSITVLFFSGSHLPHKSKSTSPGGRTQLWVREAAGVLQWLQHREWWEITSNHEQGPHYKAVWVKFGFHAKCHSEAVTKPFSEAPLDFHSYWNHHTLYRFFSLWERILPEFKKNWQQVKIIYRQQTDKRKFSESVQRFMNKAASYIYNCERPAIPKVLTPNYFRPGRTWLYQWDLSQRL